MLSVQRILPMTMLIVAAIAAPAAATTYTVTNNGDNGIGSLRDALSHANDGDTIAVPPADIVLSSTLSVSKAVTIAGAGARSTLISGNDAVKVFSINASGGTVTIQDLTV